MRSIKSRFRKMSDRMINNRTMKKRTIINRTERRNLCSCVNCGELYPNQDALLMHYCTKRRKKSLEIGESSESKETGSSEMSSTVEFKSCIVCQEKFQSSVELKCHLAKHAGRMVYSCNVCKQTFKTNLKWKDHIQESINTSHCEECGQNFGCLTANVRHKCEKLAYVCFECGAKYTKRWLLDRHLHKHKSETQCRLCDRKFARKDYYDRHTKFCKNTVAIDKDSMPEVEDKLEATEHFEISETDPNHFSLLAKDDVVNPNHEENVRASPLSCELSNNLPFQAMTQVSIKSEETLNLDSKMNFAQSNQTEEGNELTNIVCELSIENDPATPSPLSCQSSNETYIKKTDGTYCCCECDKAFMSARAVRIHQTITHKKKRWNTPCSTLEREPKNILELDGQNRSVGKIFKSRKITIYRCWKCSKVFRNAKLLESHQKVHKLLNRHTTCGKCGAQFSNKIMLREHCRTHGYKKKRFICYICNRDSVSAMDLRIHRATHYGRGFHVIVQCKRRLNFLCFQCNKVFSFKKFEGHYRNHHTVNTPTASSTMISTIESKSENDSCVGLNSSNESECGMDEMVVGDVCLSLSNEINQETLSLSEKNVEHKEVSAVDISGRVSDLVKHVNEPVEDACLPEEAKEKRDDDKMTDRQGDKQENENVLVSNNSPSNECATVHQNKFLECEICSKIVDSVPSHFHETWLGTIRCVQWDENLSFLNGGNFSEYENFLVHMHHMGFFHALKNDYVYCCPGCGEISSAMAAILNHVCAQSGKCLVKEIFAREGFIVLGTSDKKDQDSSTINPSEEELEKKFVSGLKQAVTFLFDNLIKKNSKPVDDESLKGEGEIGENLACLNESTVDKENACMPPLQHSSPNSSVEKHPSESDKPLTSKVNDTSKNCDIKKKRRRSTSIKQKLAQVRKLIDFGRISKNNPHICKVCGKKFCKPQGISNHYVTQHELAVCGSNFADDLANHEKMETVNEGERKQSVPVENMDLMPSSDLTELHELRKNFSKLLCHLVGDKDVLTDFGWPKRLIDDVLVDVIRGCDHNPAKGEQTALEDLKENIAILLRICVKEQAMENFGWNLKPVEEVVKEMLSGGDISDT